MLKLKYALLLSVVYLAGCAHPIVITPRTDKLPQANSKIIQKNVGYYISKTDHAMEVTTDGGGGDQIKYKPYADLDSGIYKVLLNIYKNVVKMTSMDKTVIAKNNISYVFTPKIKTKSSSSGVFTWPATDFEIELTMQARDANGNALWSKVVTAKGHAEYDEFKSDFQLSSRRASEELLNKLQKEILAASNLK
jgi:hypothetical protein